jgi:hypothetical protein
MRATVIMRRNRRLGQTVKCLWLDAADGFEAGQLGADVDPFVRALL